MFTELQHTGSIQWKDRLLPRDRREQLFFRVGTTWHKFQFADISNVVTAVTRAMTKSGKWSITYYELAIHPAVDAVVVASPAWEMSSEGYYPFVQADSWESLFDSTRIYGVGELVRQHFPREAERLDRAQTLRHAEGLRVRYA